MIEQGWRIVFFTYGNADDSNMLKHEGLDIVPMLGGIQAGGRLRALLRMFLFMRAATSPVIEIGQRDQIQSGYRQLAGPFRRNDFGHTAFGAWWL